MLYDGNNLSPELAESVIISCSACYIVEEKQRGKRVFSLLVQWIEIITLNFHWTGIKKLGKQMKLGL